MVQLSSFWALYLRVSSPSCGSAPASTPQPGSGPAF